MDIGHAATQASWSGHTLPAPGGTTASIGDLPIANETQYIDRVALTTGGMGKIFSAYDTKLRRRVAIKELRVVTPELAERFAREALLTASLQHPAIVSIHDAGRWPSGDPFFVMKLVPGRALDAAVADAATLEAKLALLPHVLAVADALAHAHSQGIIHRDLKPHNVMVGEFGETVVIDWGLGKRIGDTSVDHAHDDIGPSGATEIGAVLGTPAYMPPEQALGEAVDARADVYAIGAMLYHVLAGKPPFAGESSAEILAQVIDGERAPLDAGLPADLIAIVERAMQPDLDARYPTARELADDLRRFLAGQLVKARRYTTKQLLWRWLGRHRLPVSLAAAAVVALALVGGLSVRRIVAEQRRSARAELVAEQRAADADGLQQFMLIDLVGKLNEVGRLDLLSTVAEKASSYYASRPIQSAHDFYDRSQLYCNIGDIAIETRKLQAAYDAYLTDLEHGIAMQFVATTEELRSLALGTTAEAQERLSEVSALSGDAATTNQWLRASIATYQQKGSRSGVTAVRLRLGDNQLISGDFEGALATYREAAADIKPETRMALALHDKTSIALAQLRDPRGALAEARVALATATALANPDNAESLLDVAQQRGHVGEYLHELGQLPGALAELEDALHIVEHLHELDPANVAWQGELTLAVDRVCSVLIALGRTPEALDRLQSEIEATTVRLKLTGIRNAKEQLAHLHLLSGEAHAGQHEPAVAATEYEAAIALYEQLPPSQDLDRARKRLAALTK